MLAPGAAALLVFARVRNLDPEPKPLYWWTNVAVAERAGSRVLVRPIGPGAPRTTGRSSPSPAP